MASYVEAKVGGRINRPLAVVKSQFLDFDHHIARNVHPGARLTILAREGGRTKLKVETKLLGMTIVEEWVVYSSGPKSVLHEFVSGPNRGGGIDAQFSEKDGGTWVEARVFVPKQGIKWLLAPLFRMILRKTGKQALEEDRIALEEGGYEPGKGKVGT